MTASHVGTAAKYMYTAEVKCTHRLMRSGLYCALASTVNSNSGFVSAEVRLDSDDINCASTVNHDKNEVATARGA